jgi:DNA-3-methyladenine glycosylase I
VNDPGTRTSSDGITRCAWVGTDPEYARYHDEEWGRPLHGDRALFEKLSLEGFQAGLSWITILRKRDAFRAAFHNFTIEAVAGLSARDLEALMLDAGIVRNRAKIVATRNNARITLDLITDTSGKADASASASGDGNGNGAFDELMWSFAPATEPPRPRPVAPSEVPTTTPESVALSAHLRQLGYTFVGPTTMYALMQSTGMIDDHLADCWRASDPPSIDTL